MTEIDALKERLTRASKDPRLLMLPDVRAALGELVPVLDEVAELRRNVRQLAGATLQMDNIAGAISHALWRAGVSGRDPIVYGLPADVLETLKSLGAVNHAEND